MEFYYICHPPAHEGLTGRVWALRKARASMALIRHVHQSSIDMLVLRFGLHHGSGGVVESGHVRVVVLAVIDTAIAWEEAIWI